MRNARHVLGHGASRLSGSVADQAVSSLTNYVVLFAALRSLSVSGLGRFTLAYTVTHLMLAVTRSLILEPLTIRFTVAEPDARNGATAEAAGASLAVGLLAAVAAFAVTGLLSGSMSEIVASVGMILPILFVQDAWRFHFFASGRPWSAALNDAACLLFTVGAIAVTLQRPQVTVSLLLLAWGGGTLAGALFGMVQTGIRPNLLGAKRWVREHWDLGPHLAGERIATQGSSQLSFLVVGAVAGAFALGQLGAGRTLMAPVTTLVSSLIIFAVPEIARLLEYKPARVTRFVMAFSVVSVSAVGAVTVLALVVPESVGRVFAGDNWATAKSLLVPIAIWTAAAGARQGPAAALRVLGQGRTIFRLSVVNAVITITAAAIGGLVHGGAGAAWAFASASCLFAVMWWAAYLRAIRDLPAANNVVPTAKH